MEKRCEGTDSLSVCVVTRSWLLQIERLRGSLIERHIFNISM